MLGFVMILALALALSVHPLPETQASPPADLEAVMQRLAEDDLLTSWELCVVNDHPLHPVLSIGTLEQAGILSHELGPWLLAQRASLKGSSLVGEGLRAELGERFLPVVCLKDRATWEGLLAEAPSTGGTFDGLARFSALHDCLFARDGSRDETYPLARRHAALQAVGYELLGDLIAPDARGGPRRLAVPGLGQPLLDRRRLRLRGARRGVLRHLLPEGRAPDLRDPAGVRGLVAVDRRAGGDARSGGEPHDREAALQQHGF